MGKQVKVFDLLSKKQSLHVFRNQRKKNQLLEELRLATAYQKQLHEILNTMSEAEGNKTVSEIRSENWYKLKIQDELVSVGNKIDFLTIEIKDQGIQIALASEKKRKFEEKRNQLRKIDTHNRENKRETMSIAHPNNRSKF